MSLFYFLTSDLVIFFAPFFYFIRTLAPETGSYPNLLFSDLEVFGIVGISSYAMPIKLVSKSAPDIV